MRLRKWALVTSAIDRHDLGGHASAQGRGLRHVATMDGGEAKGDGVAKPAHGHVDRGAQATTGTAKGLILNPPVSAARVLVSADDCAVHDRVSDIAVICHYQAGDAVVGHQDARYRFYSYGDASLLPETPA